MMPKRKKVTSGNKKNTTGDGEKFFDKLMTAEEVAAYLRVSDTTVKRWTSQGDIPFFKIGHFNRYNMSDIQDWLETKSARV